MIDRSQKNANAHYWRGFAHWLEKDYDAALRDFTEAVKIDGSQARIFTARGRVYHDIGAYESALTDFDSAARLAPDDARIPAWREASLRRNSSGSPMDADR